MGPVSPAPVAGCRFVSLATVNRRITRAALWGLLCAAPLVALTSAGPAAATPEPPVPAPTAESLIPIPEGCPRPEPASVAFVGTMMGKDDITETVRFRIEQL